MWIFEVSNISLDATPSCAHRSRCIADAFLTWRHPTFTQTKRKRSKDEMYRHLSVDVGDDSEHDPWTVERSLQQFFQPEKRELKCEKCESGETATQTLEIISWSVTISVIVASIHLIFYVTQAHHSLQLTKSQRSPSSFQEIHRHARIESRPKFRGELRRKSEETTENGNGPPQK